MGTGAEEREHRYGQAGVEGVCAGCPRTVCFLHHPTRRPILTVRSLIAIARGEQQYFDPNGIPTAAEGCKSNAIMRTCKDIGIASELWDPRFIRRFKKEFCEEKFVEHQLTKKKKKIWRRKGEPIDYPYKIV